MAIQNFGSAFPWGAPKGAFERNTTAVGDLLKSIQGAKKAVEDIQKKQYESTLWNEYIKNIDQQPDTGSQELINAIKNKNIPKAINLLKSERTPIPSVMKERMNPTEPMGFWQGIGNQFNPRGQYTGEPTEIEKAMAESAAASGPTLKGMSTTTNIIDKLNSLINPTEKQPTETKWRHDIQENLSYFKGVIKTGQAQVKNPETKETEIKPVHTQGDLRDIATSIGIDQMPEVKKMMQASISRYPFEVTVDKQYPWSGAWGGSGKVYGGGITQESGLFPLTVKGKQVTARVNGKTMKIYANDKGEKYIINPETGQPEEIVLNKK